ncbi:MAG: hypothetical protein WCJ51_00420 [Candidatus Moraniibacteriota bacterium]
MFKIKAFQLFFKRLENFTKRLANNKNFLTLLYKLLHDCLFILLFSFAGVLIVEGLLPGLATSHLSLAKLAIVLVGVILGIVSLGKKLEITYPKTRLSKSRLLPLLIIVSFLLTSNSLLRFALWQNILITILSLCFFLLFYHLLFANEK